VVDLTWSQGAPGRDYVFQDDGIYIRRGAPPEVWAMLERLPELKMIGLQGAFSGFPPLPGWRISDEDFAHVAGCKDLEQFSVEGAVEMSAEAVGALAGLKKLRTLFVPASVLNDSTAVHLSGLASLEKLSLGPGAQVGDATLAAISDLASLRRLEAHGTSITDAGVEKIHGLENLEYLGLGKTGIGDASLDVIAGFEKLRQLDLQHTNLTDAGLEKLAGLELDWISLAGTRITSDGFARLAEMRGMTNVYASDTEIDDRAIAVLRRMKGLTVLHISGTQITAAGLNGLGGLAELAWLQVNDLPMTDETVAVLVTLPKLEHIEMNRTLVTPAGEALLAAAGIQRVNIEVPIKALTPQ